MRRPWGLVLVACLAGGARCEDKETLPPLPESQRPVAVTLGPDPNPEPDLAAMLGAEPTDPSAGSDPAPKLAPEPAEAPVAAMVEPIVLPPPPFARVSNVPRPSSRPKLLFKKVDQRREMVDSGAWMAMHDLQAPSEAVNAGAPPGVPPTLGGQPLRRILFGAVDVLVYDGNYERPPILAGWDRQAQRITFAFDFQNWRRPPQVKRGDEAFVDMGIGWAQVAGDRLYVSHFHRTYAASSGGLNGFLVALRLEDGAVVFSSDPLVANSATFAVVGGVVITGYGFTAEPDYIYALSAVDGLTLTRLRLHTAPEDIAVRRDQVLIRAYDRLYDLRLRGLRGGNGAALPPRAPGPGPGPAPSPSPTRPATRPVVAPTRAPAPAPEPPAPAPPRRDSANKPVKGNPCAPFGVARRDPDTGQIRCIPRGGDSGAG